jgi:hypothetical protein
MLHLRIFVGAAAALTILAAAVPAQASFQPHASRSAWRLAFDHHYGVASNQSSYDTVVALGKGQAWAFGGAFDGGAPVAVRRDDGRWHTAVLPKTAVGPIVAASAPSATDIWAVTEGGDVLHWNGRAWHIAKRFTGGILTGVTAFSPADVWVFGASGFALGEGTWHLHHGRWTKIHGIAGGIDSASALSPRDMWTVAVINAAMQTGLFYYNGTTWRRVKYRALAGFILLSVLAIARGNLWVSAYKGHRSWLLHLDRATWTKRAVPARQPIIYEFTADGHGGLFAVATNFKGKNWVVHMTRGGHWQDYLIGTNDTGITHLALIPGTSSVWGSGILVRKTGANAAIWKYQPAIHI